MPEPKRGGSVGEGKKAFWDSLPVSGNLLCVVLATYVIIRCLVAAATKLLSYDEILTLTMASQNGFHGIWRAMADAVDGQPLAFYAVERAALNVVRNPHFALRLPSIVAMAATIGLVFVYAKRRCGEWVALSCAVLLVATRLFQDEATNARPYSLMVACFAFALLCYQRLPSRLWAAGLILALTLAQSFHYYAIFGLAAFGFAESGLLVVKRAFRWYVWLGLAVSIVPLLVAWPVLAHLRAYYGTHFWSHYAAGDVPKAFSVFLMTSPAVGIATAILCASGIVTAMWRARTDEEDLMEEERRFAEGVLLLGLLALPALAFGVLWLSHGAMVDRYVTETVLGLTIGLGFVVRGASARGAAMFAIFAIALSGLHEFAFWRSMARHFPAQGEIVEELVKDTGQPDLPVVVSEGTSYVELLYYVPPSWKERLVYLADPQKAVEFAATDSVDKGILALRPYMRMRVAEPGAFFGEHEKFLLYREESGDAIDWLTQYLVRSGALLQLIAQRENGRVYLVTLGRTPVAHQ